MKLPDKLVMLCARKGWKQADLTRAIEQETGQVISRSSVNNWFTGKGKPDLDSALLLAKTLGVSLDYLADDEASEPVPEQASREAYENFRECLRNLKIDWTEAHRRILIFSMVDLTDRAGDFAALINDIFYDQVVLGLMKKSRAEALTTPLSAAKPKGTAGE